MKISHSRAPGRTTLAAVAALCLSSVAAVAYADGSGNEAPTYTVRYADLNLDTQVGANALYNRIQRAAEHVCGDPDLRQRFESPAARACIDRAISSSVHSVNNARLTGVYESRTGAKSISVAVLR